VFFTYTISGRSLIDEAVVFATDSGLVAMALMVYHQKVLELDGSPKLADRAYELYLKIWKIND
jgi:hypothetical protein